ncbi:DUF1622 domain-containing protein [Candidatus Omnitrophota bacterium]
MEAIHYVSLAIGLVGAAVITWGVIIAVIELLSLEIKRFKGVNICVGRDHLRHHLGSYILLGLEFLIAADIIRTVVRPTMQELAVLGGIVVIRTILSYFLNLEMRDRHRCKEA